ncbi:hypothetical protein J5N97_011820 [Dioscorea zingiberensis]|uniref:S-locus glycoprotein domain-containing protein n=1 Tax=Dioscorea zingiberensis TaxID=325984 RepID=A0A9D5HNQ1_9LILI|nr:hypothetical protein J5N97_011820 [Dioscorea zingiberensis]
MEQCYRDLRVAELRLPDGRAASRHEAQVESNERAQPGYLTGWTSPSDPFPGPYFMGIHANGDPQVILQTTKSWLWRGGNWDGVRFTGIPEMKTYSAFNFTFVDNEEEMYYMYHILDDSIISRLVVNYDGTT